MEFIKPGDFEAELSAEQEEQRKFEIKMQVQSDIIESAGGDEHGIDWAQANGKRFDELLNDPQYDFYNRFTDMEQYAEALEEIKKKLYH